MLGKVEQVPAEEIQKYLNSGKTIQKCPTICIVPTRGVRLTAAQKAELRKHEEAVAAKLEQKEQRLLGQYKF